MEYNILEEHQKESVLIKYYVPSFTYEKKSHGFNRMLWAFVSLISMFTVGVGVMIVNVLRGVFTRYHKHAVHGSHGCLKEAEYVLDFLEEFDYSKKQVFLEHLEESICVGFFTDTYYILQGEKETVRIGTSDGCICIHSC